MQSRTAWRASLTLQPTSQLLSQSRFLHSLVATGTVLDQPEGKLIRADRLAALSAPKRKAASSNANRHHDGFGLVYHLPHHACDVVADQSFPSPRSGLPLLEAQGVELWLTRS
jgi:hypothetical protein